MFHTSFALYMTTTIKSCKTNLSEWKTESQSELQVCLRKVQQSRTFLYHFLSLCAQIRTRTKPTQLASSLILKGKHVLVGLYTGVCLRDGLAISR